MPFNIPQILREWFVHAFELVRELFWATWQWAYEGLQTLLGYVASFLPAQLTADMKSLFSSTVVDNLRSVWDVTAWAFPVYPMMGVAALMFATIGVIRLARWVFALVPTLGG